MTINSGFNNNRKNTTKITQQDINKYLTKKAQKLAIKSAKKLNSQYSNSNSNDSERFRDPNPNELFIWRKKIARDVSRGVAIEEFSVRAAKRRRRERMVEVEKVMKRREERAVEKARREGELAVLARDGVYDWEKKEREFVFEQSRVRSRIRVREGRMKAIDVLSNIIDCFNAKSFEYGIDCFDEPYSVFRGLSLKELEELREDIVMHLDFDVDREYWEALLVVCDWELTQCRNKETSLHPSVEADVQNLLQGKSYDELEKFRIQIELGLRSGTAKVVEYWERVLERLHFFKAKACLKEIHTQCLVRLEKPSSKKDTNQESEKYDIHEEKGVQGFDAGSFSPQLLHGNDNEEAIDPVEDFSSLEKKRISVLEQRNQGINEYRKFENRALKAMGKKEEGDGVFGSSDEVNVEAREVYWWDDKYRARKPKYLNRVHTGYEWNKYNRTHYDHENPPPKTVQGYKFNIFYPDLVDKSRAPSYTVEKDGDDSETCILLFHAGPPYEDIAFRIVNKEWECSQKKGYKCTFERGILHLYFNFKRFPYRR